MHYSTKKLPDDIAAINKLNFIFNISTKSFNSYHNSNAFKILANLSIYYQSFEQMQLYLVWKFQVHFQIKIEAIKNKNKQLCANIFLQH